MASNVKKKTDNRTKFYERGDGLGWQSKGMQVSFWPTLVPSLSLFIEKPLST